MDVKIYTQNQTLFPSTHSFVFRYFEYILLFLVAATGLLCSAFALSDNSSMPSNENFRQVVSLDAARKSDFDKYVKIEGERKTGSELQFEISLNLAEKRYVMEMGDGRRMILTSPKFNYTYPAKGEYILELKEIQRGLIVLIGEKKVKIKD
ncbi:MAG: hypothetical protein IPN29_15300 [Saprospiraceae bacterium]|nr:hypothetical protein [Saprospiraceae bacterium]